MFTVSDQQAEQRWDVLTPPLREALFSDVNGDFVWKLCQDNHLTDEKSYQVGELAGYVLYGFIHPEDLSDELVKSLDLPKPVAKSIADAINTRVFVSLKADLDKVYSPLIKSAGAGGALSAASTGPKIIQNTTTPISPKPTILSDVGWSKTLPSAFVAPHIPTPTPPPAPAPIAPATPSRPPTPPPVVTSAKPAESAPVMLHEDTAFKAVEKNASFTLSRPAGGAEVRLGPSTVPTPPRSAVLEFGGVKPPAPGNTPASVGFRPPLSTAPTASAGPRSVSQIVPPSSSPTPPPLPPTPPKPPAATPTPPMPPKPPQAPQGDKPIVKDFL